MTTIIAAALFLNGKAHSLPKPARHHDVIGHMSRDGVSVEDISGAEQGFITSDGQFVRRKPALRIAQNAGQIIRSTAPAHGLFSEDIW